MLQICIAVFVQKSFFGLFHCQQFTRESLTSYLPFTSHDKRIVQRDLASNTGKRLIDEVSNVEY